jgi:hypothetical protein
MNKLPYGMYRRYSLVGINVWAKLSASKVRMEAYENGVILFHKNAWRFLAEYKADRSERIFIFLSGKKR